MLTCPKLKVAPAALALCCLLATHAFAQGVGRAEPILVNGNSNEDSKAMLDLLAQAAGGDKLIILVGRLGRRESSSRLSWRRLRTASSHLELTRAVPSQRIVLAAGEPIRDQGRIEVYLGGELYTLVVFARNKNFAPEP